MGEFERLMQGESERPDIQKKRQSRKATHQMLLWGLGLSVLFTIIPPHLGILLLLPLLLFAFVFYLTEWVG